MTLRERLEKQQQQAAEDAQLQGYMQAQLQQPGGATQEGLLPLLLGLVALGVLGMFLFILAKKQKKQA